MLGNHSSAPDPERHALSRSLGREIRRCLETIVPAAPRGVDPASAGLRGSRDRDAARLLGKERGQSTVQGDEEPQGLSDRQGTQTMKAFTDEALNRLKEALADEEPSCAPEGCPSKDELWDSAGGELDPLENEAIILHLARCSECWHVDLAAGSGDARSRPGLVIFSDPRERREAMANVAKGVRAGHRRHDGDRRRSERRVARQKGRVVAAGFPPTAGDRRNCGFTGNTGASSLCLQPRVERRSRRDSLRSHRHRSGAGNRQHGQGADATGIRPSSGNNPDLHNGGVLAGHSSSGGWTHGFV